MAKHSPNYAITALLTITAACIGYVISQKQPVVSFDARLDALPMKVGRWRGQDVKLDAGTRNALSADRILCRYYTDSRTGRQISLVVVYRKYGRRGFAHRPELCYPAAGWEVVSTSYTDIPYAGHDVQARRVEAQRDGNRAVVTYWFASGRRTEANYVKQQVRMALDRLQRQKYGWAFIRADITELGGPKEAFDLTRAFMKDMERPLARVLTRSK